MILRPPPISATQMNGIIPAQLFTAPKRPKSSSKRIILSEHDDPTIDDDKVYLHQQEQLHEQHMEKIRTYGYTWIVPLGRRKTRQEELNEEANEQDQEEEEDDDDEEEVSGALDGQDNDSGEQRDLDASIEDLDAVDDEDQQGDEDEENDPDNLQPSTSSDDFPNRSDATDPSFMRQEYMGNLSGDISGDIDMSAMDMEGDI